MSPLKLLLKPPCTPSEKMHLRMKLKAPHQKNCWKSWRRSELWWSSCNNFCCDLNSYDTETSSSVLSFVYFVQKWKFSRRILICWPSSCDLIRPTVDLLLAAVWHELFMSSQVLMCWITSIIMSVQHVCVDWFSQQRHNGHTGNDANAANAMLTLHDVSPIWRAQGWVLCFILLDYLTINWDWKSSSMWDWFSLLSVSQTLTNRSTAVNVAALLDGAGWAGGVWPTWPQSSLLLCCLLVCLFVKPLSQWHHHVIMTDAKLWLVRDRCEVCFVSQTSHSNLMWLVTPTDRKSDWIWQKLVVLSFHHFVLEYLNIFWINRHTDSCNNQICMSDNLVQHQIPATVQRQSPQPKLP